MTSKSSIISDHDDYSSVYTDDFETDSLPSSPNLKKKYIDVKKSNEDRKSAKSNRSSPDIYKLTTQSTVKKKSHLTKPSHPAKGRKSTAFSKTGKKNPGLIKPDLVQTRMLSAQRSRINTLNNELGEVQNRLDELIKENKVLRNLQFRQEKSLRKFENKDGDIPRLIAHYEEDQRVLKAKLRKCQEAERVLETRLRESNEEIQRLEGSVHRMKKLVDDKNLGERSELAKQLNSLQDRLYDSEKKNQELEKKVDLSAQSYTRQLNTEKTKHTETKDKLKHLQEKYEDMENRLKDKERALQVSNIYALRAKHTVDKPSHGFKTGHSKARKSANGDRLKPPAGQSPSPLKENNSQPLEAASNGRTGSASDDPSTSPGLRNVPNGSASKTRQDTTEIENKLNSLNMQISKNKDCLNDHISFNGASESSHEKNPTASSQRDSTTTNLIREKSFTVEPKPKENIDEKELEDRKKIEDRKKALLTKMKNVDDDKHSSENDLQHLLGNGLASSNKTTKTKNAETGDAVSKQVKKNNDAPDPEFTFGGYAPTVTSAPKRKLQPRAGAVGHTPPSSDPDEPLLDLNSGKSKPNDLLQQLFGGDAVGRPMSNELNKKDKPHEAIRRPSLAKATLRSQQNGHSNGVRRASNSRTNGAGKNSPLVKTAGNSFDDEIEEMVL